MTWAATVRWLSPLSQDLGCHGTRYVRHGRGWYVYVHRVRTVRVAPGASCPAPPVRTPHKRLIRDTPRSPHVQYGGSGTHMSTQGAASLSLEQQATDADRVAIGVTMDPSERLVVRLARTFANLALARRSQCGARLRSQPGELVV